MKDWKSFGENEGRLRGDIFLTNIHSDGSGGGKIIYLLNKEVI